MNEAKTIRIVKPKEKVEISNVVVSNSDGIDIDSASIVIINGLQLSNARAGLSVDGAKVYMKNVILDTIQYCFRLNSCGVSIFFTEDFVIESTSVKSADYGFQIYKSKGVIINSNAINNKRASGTFNQNGGGIRVIEGTVKMINVDLINNSVGQSGGGFHCEKSTLDVYGGKIQLNRALSGGAGQCDSECKFFAVGVDIKENSEREPSKCNGISNVLKKLKK